MLVCAYSVVLFCCFIRRDAGLEDLEKLTLDAITGPADDADDADDSDAGKAVAADAPPANK